VSSKPNPIPLGSFAPVQGPPVPLELGRRLALIVKLMRGAIETHGLRNPAALPMILLVSTYLARALARFNALAGRVRAGTAAARNRPPATTSRPAPTRPHAASFPSRPFWLLRLAPGHNLAAAGGQLRHLLASPDMAAFLAAAPHAARLLRPLCRMLGITGAADLPAALFPPRPKRPATPRPPKPPRPPRPPRVRAARSRPVQLYPTETWQQREALDKELEEWHATRPYVLPAGCEPVFPNPAFPNPAFPNAVMDKPSTPPPSRYPPGSWFCKPTL
jgi:hypothetical protein